MPTTVLAIHIRNGKTVTVMDSRIKLSNCNKLIKLPLLF